jgi:hypothetical protein
MAQVAWGEVAASACIGFYRQYPSTFAQGIVQNGRYSFQLRRLNAEQQRFGFPSYRIP